jgi:amino acid permease
MISHVISLALFVFIGVFGLGTYGQDVEVGNQKFGRK